MAGRINANAAQSAAFAVSGAGNRSRTYDLRITNALLYQLSYSGEGGGVYGFESRAGTSGFTREARLPAKSVDTQR